MTPPLASKSRITPGRDSSLAATAASEPLDDHPLPKAPGIEAAVGPGLKPASSSFPGPVAVLLANQQNYDSIEYLGRRIAHDKSGHCR